MEKSETTSIIIGTVQGDINDIGKNVLISLLQASGFQVHDLGTDVLGDHFIEKLKETQAPILALSSLLTSSAPEIKVVIELLKTTGLRHQVKVIIGGAAVTKEFAKQALERTIKKKPHELFDKVNFIELEEGKCVQMMHLGSYDNEPETFKIMESFCRDNGLVRESKKHREIYISDARKVEPEKLKTTLRFRVK